MGYKYNSMNKYLHARRHRYVDGTKMGKKRPVGYCWCERHRGYLSKALLEKHKCDKRQCSFYEKIKYDNAPAQTQNRKEARA